MDEIKLAKLFHQVYEDLAPSFGYETRTNTKEFDKNSKNGKLMIATCKAILPEIKASQLDALVRRLAEKKQWLERQKEVAKNIKADLAMACWIGTIIITEQLIKEVEAIGKTA